MSPIMVLDFVEIPKSQYYAARNDNPKLVHEQKPNGFCYRVSEGRYQLFYTREGKFYRAELGDYVVMEWKHSKFKSHVVRHIITFENTYLGIKDMDNDGKGKDSAA